MQTTGWLLSIVLYLFSTLSASGSGGELQQALQLADRAYRSQDFDRAATLYQEMVSDHPESVEAHVGLGLVSIRRGEYEQAIQAFQTALELAPDAPAIQGELAEAYRKQGDLDAAHQWYERAIEQAGEGASVGWYIGLGLIENARGDDEKARQYYISAVLHDPKSTVAYQNLGGVLLQQHRLDEADAAFQMVLELDESMDAAYFGRGQVAAKRQDYEAASEFYRRAVELRPEDPGYHYAYAQVLEQLGRQQDAAMELAESYLQKALELRKTNRWQESQGQLKKALEADPKSLDVRSEWAYGLMRLGGLERARQEYETILRETPDQPKVIYYLGRIAQAQRRFEQAASYLRRAIELAPDSPDGYTHLASVQEAQGDLDGAEATYSMALERAGTWAPGYWWRGQIRFKQGNLAGAEEDLRTAIRLAPDVPYPKATLARLLVEAHRQLDEALQLATEAVAADPSPQHTAILALTHHALGHLEKARELISQAGVVASDDLQVEQIRMLITGKD